MSVFLPSWVAPVQNTCRLRGDGLRQCSMLLNVAQPSSFTWCSCLLIRALDVVAFGAVPLLHTHSVLDSAHLIPRRVMHSQHMSTLTLQ